VAETVGRLLFPFMITFLLVFLVIFEYILGAFAELTRTYPFLINFYIFLTLV
jgi:sterol O-acyltransferase